MFNTLENNVRVSQRSYIRININTVNITRKTSTFRESKLWEEVEGCEGIYVEVEGYEGLGDLF